MGNGVFRRIKGSTREWIHGKGHSGQDYIPLPSSEYHLPHKIFLWDTNGEYIDCSYPNPIHGHFFGATRLIGARIQDVFSRTVSSRLIKAIAATQRTKREHQTHVQFERTNVAYETKVRCLPMQGGMVLGLVIDRMLKEHAKDFQMSSQHYSWMSHPCRPIAGQWLTPRQYQIVQEVLCGFKYEEIGEHLNITERTVKSHLQKIYSKFQVSNRFGLIVHLVQNATSPRLPHPNFTETAPTFNPE